MEENENLNNEEVKAEETKPEEAAPTEEKPVEEATPASEAAPAPEAAPAEEPKDDYNGKAKNYDNSVFSPIRYVNDGTISIEEDMSKLTEKYNKKLSTSRIMDIVSVACMALAFGAVVLVTMLNTDSSMAWLTWVVLGIALAIIVASFIMTTVFNKKNAKTANDYLAEYQDMLNGYALKDLHLEEPTLCVDAEIDDQEVIQAHYYKTISAIQSRGLVEAKRNGLHFASAEVAVAVPTISVANANKKPEDYVTFTGAKYVEDNVAATSTGTSEVQSKDMTLLDMELSEDLSNPKAAKKRERDQKKAASKVKTDTNTGLFGRLFSYGNKVLSEEAIIVCFQGDRQNTYMPTHLTGLRALKVPNLKSNVIVYCASPMLAAKFFDAEGVKILNDINTGLVVQSLFISVNAYGSKLGMFLSDDIMNLTFKKVAKGSCYEQYKEALDKSFAFIDYVDQKASK